MRFLALMPGHVEPQPARLELLAVGEHAAAQPEYWQPAVNYLSRHLTPSYRVESVDTAGHWAAAYLPRAGIPLTRGWFRQDDFPQNEVLYDQLDRAHVPPLAAKPRRAGTSC